MHRILYVQYGNPAAFPPIERGATQFADAGWDVLFVGAHTAGVEAMALRSHPRMRAVLLPTSRGGWRLKLHYVWFCLWAMWQVLRFRPTWIYASDVLSAPVALALRTVARMRVVYHEHDAYEPAHATAFMRFCAASRRALSRLSVFNVLPNEERIEHFIQINGAPRERCVCVWNCPSVSEVRPPKPLANHSTVTLLYQGSIVPDRLPLTVLEAMSKLPELVRLRVIGYETIDNRGYIDRLTRAAEQWQLRGRVEFMPAVSHAELVTLTEACDIGLALMPLASADINMRAMAGASNKAFEYLACGLPMLVSAQADWQTMFVAPGYAQSCDPQNADSIAAAVRWFLQDPDRVRAMGEAGRQRVLSEWNYERQFAAVFRKLSGA